MSLPDPDYQNWRARQENEQQEEGAPVRITRVIDFRIPLPYLLSGAIAVTCILISMYFSVQQLIRDVGELQVTVKAGNTQASTVAGEIALLRYRVQNLENAELTAEKAKR